MRLISHRGNVDSIQPERENTQEYIEEAISRGYDVEIDIWCTKDYNFYLGHDKPENPVEINWLYKNRHHLWIHAKDFKTLSRINSFSDFKVFYHKLEDHTVILHTDKLYWSHNIEEASEDSVIPLLSEKELLSYDKSKKVFGICSDFVGKYGKS